MWNGSFCAEIGLRVNRTNIERNKELFKNLRFILTPSQKKYVEKYLGG